MSAVLTVGEKSVEEQDRLEEIEELLKAEEDKRKESKASLERARKVIDSVYEDVSKNVVALVSNAGGRWRSRTSFSRAKVREAYEHAKPEWSELDESNLQSNIAILNSGNRPKLPPIQSTVPIANDLIDRLKLHLLKTPMTIVLDTLEAHPEATIWVQEGRQLHEGSSSCIFCSGPLTDDRKAAIEDHFSDAVAELEREIDAILGELRIAEKQCETVRLSLPDEGLLLEDLREAYRSSKQDVENALRRLEGWCRELGKVARKKRENVLAPFELLQTQVESPRVNDARFKALCAMHDERVERHEEALQEAAKAVEEHYLKLNEETVVLQKKIVAESSQEFDVASQNIGDLARERDALNNREADPMPAAEVLTREVARMLGRSELTFELYENQYRVMRNGEPAVGLSTGERSVIMLIYFMEAVARVPGPKPIVVIDDPVSSMDSDVFMGISTYIWSEAVVKESMAQLILLTHNFELFRQWDIQLTSAKHIKSSLYELRSKHKSGLDGDLRRTPDLVAWPPSNKVRKKIRSTYYHAFMVVEEAKRNLNENDSLENRLDAQLLFPNVIRRLLESFLAFKFPASVGDFNGSMRNAGEYLKDSGYNGDADALRLRLTRYTHAYSHNESPSIGDIVSPDEVRTAISAVFVFMKALDPQHLSGLCEVLEIDESGLVSDF